jgi:hypothetical protein
MPRNEATEEEIIEEIRRTIRQEQRVNLTDKKIRRYMKNPEAYKPPRIAIVEFVSRQIHLAKTHPRIAHLTDCSEEHAILLLRYPFTEKARIGQAAVAIARRNERASRKALTGKSLHQSMNALPPR